MAPPRWRSPPSVPLAPVPSAIPADGPRRRAARPGHRRRPPIRAIADRRRRSGRRHEHAVLRDGQRRHPGLHPDWRPFEPPQAPDGTPSVVYIVLDDARVLRHELLRRADPARCGTARTRSERRRIKTQPGTFMIAGKGLCIGRDSGAGVSTDYPGEMPWRFTGGTIRRVAVDVSGEPYVDLEREAAAMLIGARSRAGSRRAAGSHHPAAAMPPLTTRLVASAAPWMSPTDEERGAADQDDDERDEQRHGAPPGDDGGERGDRQRADETEVADGVPGADRAARPGRPARRRARRRTSRRWPGAGRRPVRRGRRAPPAARGWRRCRPPRRPAWSAR